MVNKLKTTGSLLDKKPDWKQTVLTEELDDTGASTGDRSFENICMKGHKIVKTVTI
jgi:hypothetical protein